jgi:hypothetical protein
VNVVSSKTPSSVYEAGLAVLAADVITTRFTPAAVAARRTFSAPSRAGTMNSSGRPGSAPPER